MKVNWNFRSHLAHEQNTIKRQPGSIRVGATGKVSTLMTHELDEVKGSSSHHVSRKRNTQNFPVTVYCGESRRQACYQSGNSTTSTGQRAETRQKQQHNMRHTGRDIPVFASEDASVHMKPVRDEKRKPQYIEVVDLKCGTSLKKAWSRHTTKNRSLKFSRLSVSN
ncbi:hypothetical protein DCAR_0625155 [Daucus carota subsp. sativus]|uniref:Uncharacterized protein n=1 Tax=Daucus carota subsp. sativus TaxID=79200 RepID=A0A164W9A6_DAUCS|nr:hypothetical protein DCAR_0625155 [Daucus carota subsp. sativus]